MLCTPASLVGPPCSFRAQLRPGPRSPAPEAVFSQQPHAASPARTRAAAAATCRRSAVPRSAPAAAMRRLKAVFFGEPLGSEKSCSE